MPLPFLARRNKMSHIKQVQAPLRGLKNFQSRTCAPWHHQPGRRRLRINGHDLPSCSRKLSWNKGKEKSDAFRTHCCPRRLTPLKQDESSPQFTTVVAIVRPSYYPTLPTSELSYVPCPASVVSARLGTHTLRSCRQHIMVTASRVYKFPLFFERGFFGNCGRQVSLHG